MERGAFEDTLPADGFFTCAEDARNVQTRRKGFVYSRFYKPFRDGSLEQDKRFCRVFDKGQSATFLRQHYEKEFAKWTGRPFSAAVAYGKLGNAEDDPLALMPYDNILNILRIRPYNPGRSI